MEQHPRPEEALERRDPRLVEGEPTLRHERVAAQPLDVDADLDAREERVAPDVVEVVDREDAGQEGLEQPDPAGHRRDP